MHPIVNADLITQLRNYIRCRFKIELSLVTQVVPENVELLIENAIIPAFEKKLLAQQDFLRNLHQACMSSEFIIVSKWITLSIMTAQKWAYEGSAPLKAGMNLEHLSAMATVDTHRIFSEYLEAPKSSTTEYSVFQHGDIDIVEHASLSSCVKLDAKTYTGVSDYLYIRDLGKVHNVYSANKDGQIIAVATEHIKSEKIEEIELVNGSTDKEKVLEAFIAFRPNSAPTIS